MRNFNEYYDENGLIIQHKQKGADGGDTVNRMGHWAIAEFFRGKLNKREIATRYYIKVNTHLHNGRGVLRRYVKPPHDHWESATRDQITPNLIASCLLNLKPMVKLLLQEFIKNFGFTRKLRPHGVYQDEETHRKLKPGKPWNWNNTYSDFLITHIPIYLRYYKPFGYRCILWIFDVELLCGAIVKAYLYRFNRKVKGGDDLNFIARILYSTECSPTFISSLARWFYKKRPHMKTLDPKHSYMFKHYDYETKSGPQSALQYYCARNHFRDPPLDLLYRPTVERLL